MLACRSDSPLSAAAPPPAAGNTGNGCAKSDFLAFLPQLSSPFFPVLLGNPLRRCWILRESISNEGKDVSLKQWRNWRKTSSASAEFAEFCAIPDEVDKVEKKI